MIYNSPIPDRTEEVHEKLSVAVNIDMKYCNTDKLLTPVAIPILQNSHKRKIQQQRIESHKKFIHPENINLQ